MKQRRVEIRGRRVQGRRGDMVSLGYLSWTARGGLTFVLRDRQLQVALERAVRERVRQDLYFVAAVVGTGRRLMGLRLDRVDASMPEVLRCIAADDALWRRPHGGYRLTAEYADRMERRPEGRGG